MSVVVKKSSSHPSSPETQQTDSPEPSSGENISNDNRVQGQGQAQNPGMGSPGSGEKSVWGQTFMDSLMSTDPVVTTALMESFPSYYPDAFNYPSSAQSATFPSGPNSATTQSPASFGNTRLGTPATGFAEFDYAALGPLPDGSTSAGAAGVAAPFGVPQGQGGVPNAPTAEEVWRHFLGDLDMNMGNQAV